MPDSPAEHAAQEAYHELCAYTLTHGDRSFIHVVDAHAAQHARAESKAISTAFALVGLYLQVERHATGRQVQLAHRRLARTRKQWPAFTPPKARGALTVFDVLHAPPGAARDQAIRQWSVSVWDSWRGSHSQVVDVLQELGELGAPPPPLQSPRRAGAG